MVVFKVFLFKIFIFFIVFGGLKYFDNFFMIVLLREKFDGVFSGFFLFWSIFM